MTQQEQISERIKLVEPVSMVIDLTSTTLATPLIQAGLQVDLQPGAVLCLVSIQPVFEGRWQVVIPITIGTPNAETVYINRPIPMDCAYPLDSQGQMVIGCHCEGCEWWNDWGLGDLATHCEDGTAPEPWHAAAMGGGLPDCPHHSASDVGNAV